MMSRINSRYESLNGGKKVGDLRNRNKTNVVSKEVKDDGFEECYLMGFVV